jgi:hypothetical protein
LDAIPAGGAAKRLKTLYLWLIGNLDTYFVSFPDEETVGYIFQKVGRCFLSKNQRRYIYNLAWGVGWRGGNKQTSK